MNCHISDNNNNNNNNNNNKQLKFLKTHSTYKCLDAFYNRYVFKALLKLSTELLWIGFCPALSGTAVFALERKWISWIYWDGRKWGLGFRSPNPLVSVRCSMCVNKLFQFWAVSVYWTCVLCIPGRSSCYSGIKRYLMQLLSFFQVLHSRNPQIFADSNGSRATTNQSTRSIHNTV